GVAGGTAERRGRGCLFHRAAGAQSSAVIVARRSSAAPFAHAAHRGSDAAVHRIPLPVGLAECRAVLHGERGAAGCRNVGCSTFGRTVCGFVKHGETQLGRAQAVGKGRPWYTILYLQVLMAVVIGSLIGRFFPRTGVALKPLGDAFVSLIRMMIAPVIFCVIVQGIASMSDLKKVGKVGVKTLIYFELVSTLALMIGIVVALLIHPGAGLNIDPATLDPKAAAVYVGRAKETGFIPFLLGFIPRTFVGALADGEVPQVLLISILTGFAIARMGAWGKRALGAIEIANKVVFGIVRMVVRAAPLGALGGMAFTVGSYGMASLTNLLKLMGTFYLSSVVFVVVILGTIAYLAGFSIFRFLAYIKDEL